MMLSPKILMGKRDTITLHIHILLFLRQMLKKVHGVKINYSKVITTHLLHSSLQTTQHFLVS